MGSAVFQFAVSGLLSLVVVGFLAAYQLRQDGISEAKGHAKDITRVMARGIIQPNLEMALDPDTEPAFDAKVHDQIRVPNPDVLRVKIWSEDGTIVYSDEPKLIGKRFPLGEEERDAIRRNTPEAELSDLGKPENKYERRFGKLLEVYTGVDGPDGKRYLFETYQEFSSVSSTGTRIMKDFAPPLIIALVLLWLVQVPLAVSLARRLREGQKEREMLLLRAIDASDTERRRIAADLHDGVVQDLAGISFSLGAAADRVETARPDELSALLRRGASGTRQSMRRLRSLLLEIYPPNLQTAGLSAALTDLLAPLLHRGVDAQLDVEGSLDLAPESEELIFRTAQESLRNVAAHAHASTVRVRLDARNGSVVLLVVDDGKGFTPQDVERRRSEGHVGLSLLADRAHDLGGSLVLDSTPGEGTRLRLEVPRG